MPIDIDTYCAVTTDRGQGLPAIRASRLERLLTLELSGADHGTHSRRLLAAEPLHRVDTATTVRVRGGEVTLFDGPFAETREMLAGFYLIDARDLNEAIQLAARIPPARCGSVEVRPVRELKP